MLILWLSDVDDSGLSLYLKNVCICWNKSVRRIVNIPYTTHTHMDVTTHFKPSTQYTVNHSTQVIKRCIRFLVGMASSHDINVYTCYKNAVANANTPMDSNIAYFRNKYTCLVLNMVLK